MGGWARCQAGGVVDRVRVWGGWQGGWPGGVVGRWVGWPCGVAGRVGRQVSGYVSTGRRVYV